MMIKPITLTVADYQIGSEVGVERKSTKDFVKSIIDKRLNRQAKELVMNFQNPVIDTLEGKNIYAGGSHPNAVRGALASRLWISGTHNSNKFS